MRRACACLLFTWFFQAYPVDPSKFFPALEVSGFHSLIECLKASAEVERVSRGTLIAGMCWPELDQMAALDGASCCVPCQRRLPKDFRGRADGESESKSARVEWAPALPDDFCRYCSRAISELAQELERASARPRQTDAGGVIAMTSHDRLVRM